MFSTLRRTLVRVATSYVTYVVLGVVVGAAVAPAVWTASNEPDGTVAVVSVAGGIDGASAASVVDMLEEARSDPDVKAVVIVSNSGGGTATASEALYLQTKRTAGQMPVVASVDAAAASGAYYTIVPSDYVYAKPSSLVGSVGVVANRPASLEPNAVLGTTGPNKLSGTDEREFFAMLESNRRAFVNAVVSQRGDRLELTRAELSQAQLYSGSQAVRNGLVDDIGDRQAAIARAARLADLDAYHVRTLRPDNGTARFVSRNNYLPSTAANKTMVDTSYYTDNRSSPPVILMMPASYLVRDDAAGDSEAVSVGDSPASNVSNRIVSTRPTGIDRDAAEVADATA